MKPVLHKVQNGIELGKRTYLGGVRFNTLCPDCGALLQRDFGEDYLQYPITGKYEDIDLYCESCDKELPRVAEIKVEITATIRTL